MARPSTRPRTSVQDMLIDLRHCLGLTQEQFAREFGVTASCVAKWESKVPPGFMSLARLAAFAAKRGLPSFSESFIAAGEARLRNASSTSNQPTAQVA